MSERTRWALRNVLLILIVLMLAGTSALADTIAVRFNADAKIYETASTSARYVKAPQDLKVSLIGYDNGWGKISYKGYQGYVKLKYLDRVDPLTAYTSKAVTVYSDTEASRSLGKLAAGTKISVVGVDGSYVRICNRSGSYGYIRASAVTSTPPSSGEREKDESTAVAAIPESLRSTTTSPDASKIEYTIYVAQNLMGLPYSGDPEPPKSFDCARFVRYCYGKAQNDALKSSCKSQGYDERYEKVEYDDLRRGDLVCFDTVDDGDQCDHVGIYLGGGYFLHASSAAQKVILSSLNSGYYQRTFSWGRRIFDN